MAGGPDLGLILWDKWVAGVKRRRAGGAEGGGGLRMRSLGNRLYDKGKKSAEWERTKQTNKGTCVGESLEEEGERRLLGK